MNLSRLHRQYSALPLCLLLLTRCSFAAPTATTPDDAMPIADDAKAPPSAGAVLLRYQTALDQIALGHLTEARVILEDAIRRYGDEPNWNLLLAYLLEREGRDDDARQWLAAVADQSRVAAYAAQPPSASPPSSASQPANAAQPATTPAATMKTAAEVPQADARLAKFEQAMAQMVNAERAKAGLAALTFDAKLSGVARAHSAEMRDRNYFAHESPTTALRQPLDRYRAAFQTMPAVLAENVFRAWGGRHQLGEDDVRKAHASLMASPGHRGNIMQARVTRIGIGILTNATGDIWVTQMFSRVE